MRRKKTVFVHDLLLGAACPCSHRSTDETGKETACDCPASYDAIFVVKPIPGDDLWHAPIGYCEKHGGRMHAEQEASRQAKEKTVELQGLPCSSR